MAHQRALAVQAWESLFRAQVSVMRQLAAEFPKGEISIAEYDVLFTLSTEPERQLRARDLGRNVLLTQPSVSRMTDRLVRRGLVSKCADPGDGRVLDEPALGRLERVRHRRRAPREVHRAHARESACERM